MAKEDEGMWCIVMFDLPVKTKTQQRTANAFRNLLLDLGYWRAQFSVYVRYNPTASGSLSSLKTIKNELPANGEVRVVHVTDKQWSKGLRFSNREEPDPEDQPSQLTIF